MLEFYRENVKYLFKILYHKHIILLFMVLPLVILASAAGLWGISKVDRDLFNIAFFCMLNSLFLFIIGWFTWNFLFITVYSLLKEEQDDRVFTGILYSIYGELTNRKTLLIVFAGLLGIATLSALIYLFVVPNAELYHLVKMALLREIEVAIAALLTAFILVSFIRRAAIWKTMIHLIHTLRGMLVRMLVIFVSALVVTLLFGGMFGFVLLILDPILRQILGISG